MLPVLAMTPTLLLLTGLLAATGESLTFALSDWPAPQHAGALTANRALAEWVNRYDSNLNIVRIRHAGGDPDSRFAERLRDALVALGIPSARIRLVPAAADSGHLILELSKPGEPGS